VNTGIEAKNSRIKDSKLTNRTSGNISANASTVSTGIKVNNATISSSELSTNTNANINAIGSTVGTGIQVDRAVNSKLSTNVNANINAAGSTVNVGSIRGSVDGKDISTNVSTSVNARGKTVNIGNVIVNGGKVTRYDNNGKLITPRKKKEKVTSVGNVIVESDMVKEVKTTIGSSGKVGERVKVRHKARVNADEGGVDDDGTKYTYVNKRTRQKAESKGTGAGDTHIGKDNRKIKRVNTYVE
jgi:hypothetical protein